LDGLITGANLINRGVNAGPLSFNVNFSKPPNKAGQNKISKAGFSISENNFSANYTYNPNEAKQGKMDVIIDFPTGNINDPIERLRVSAKNWNSTRTVGTTSIDAGLTRSVGFKVAEYYRMAMLNTGLD
jgi:hypothetical protein